MSVPAAATATSHAATAAATAATAAAAAAADAALAVSACTATNTAPPPILAHAVRAMVAGEQLKRDAIDTFAKLEEAAGRAAWRAPMPTATTVDESIYDLTGRAADACEFARYEAHIATLVAEGRQRGMKEDILRWRVRYLRLMYLRPRNDSLCPLDDSGVVRIMRQMEQEWKY